MDTRRTTKVSSTADIYHSFLIRRSSRPLAVVVAFFLLGIVSSSVCRQYHFSGVALATALLICASALSLNRKRLELSFFLSLSSVALGGFLMMIAHRDGFSRSDLRSLLARKVFTLDEPVLFDGCVAEESQTRNEESITTIQLRGILQNGTWMPCNGKGIITMPEPSANSENQQTTLRWGDRVRGWATWHVPHNFRNPGSPDRVGSLARRGVFLIGRVKSPRLLETIPGDCAKPWSRMAIAVRDHFRRTVEPIRSKGNKQPAAILSSIVIGDYSGLSSATREAFQNSGTYHVLVVSGLHVASLAFVLLQLFRLVRLPLSISRMLVASAIIAYTCVAGFQASITRCLWMFVLYVIGQMLFRRAEPTNILFAAALILLVLQPDWLFEVGFQLSFLSVMAIAMMAAPMTEKGLRPLLEPLRHAGESTYLSLRKGRWPRRGRALRTRCELFVEQCSDRLPPVVSHFLFLLLRSLATAGLAIGSMTMVSLSVQVWLESILAYNFNRLSWISPLANLVTVPLSSLVLAAGVTAALTADLYCLGPAMVRFAGWISSLLLDCTTHIAGSPATWQRCPTPSMIWVLGSVLLLFIWCFIEQQRFWIPGIYLGVLLAFLSSSSTVPRMEAAAGAFGLRSYKEKELWEKNNRILRFTFLDVGEGDSIVISFPGGQLWVLDAGGLRQASATEDGAYAFDIGEAVVSRYLWSLWATKLDRLVLSHPDRDHAGGMPALIRNFGVGQIYYSRHINDQILDGIIELAHDKGTRTIAVHSGNQERVGDVAIQAFNPPEFKPESSNNDNSLVLRFSFKNFTALLTGDLEKAGEARVMSYSKDLHSLLLKVAHHGSRSATSESFLRAVQPRWAVISAGRRNPYGHPSREVLSRLIRCGCRPFLTLDNGAITIETDGIDYAIRSYAGGVLERGTISPNGKPRKSNFSTCPPALYGTNSRHAPTTSD